MTEPIWINLRVIKAFHDRQINEHGGLPGLRDEGLLLSALSRPENAFHYTDPKPDVAELAAAYGFGLAKNHPFNDANKRTALIATRLFLKLNGNFFRHTFSFLFIVTSFTSRKNRNIFNYSKRDLYIFFNFFYFNIFYF